MVDVVDELDRIIIHDPRCGIEIFTVAVGCDLDVGSPHTDATVWDSVGSLDRESDRARRWRPSHASPEIVFRNFDRELVEPAEFTVGHLGSPESSEATI